MEQIMAGVSGMPEAYMLEWLAAVVLILVAVALSLFDLPGNTLMVGCCLGFAFYDPSKYFDVRIISAVILIYAMGEIWEFVLSFFGIKRKVKDISWWGVFLIGCGTFAGTVMGTTTFPVARRSRSSASPSGARSSGRLWLMCGFRLPSASQSRSVARLFSRVSGAKAR